MSAEVPCLATWGKSFFYEVNSSYSGMQYRAGKEKKRSCLPVFATLVCCFICDAMNCSQSSAGMTGVSLFLTKHN